MGWLLAACAVSTQQGPAPPPRAQASADTSVSMQASAATTGNSDAKLMAEFNAKVEDYVTLRKDLEDDTPLNKIDDPKEILMAEEALAAKVRVARAGAKRGELFTPEIQALFRRLLNPATKGPDGREILAAIADDGPEPAHVPFQVNAVYPRNEPLSTVPPDILMSLPQLPTDIQYRFVGRHLILYDAKTNIIVDFMLNALPPITPVKR
jgi:hypothetical protein